VSGIQVSAGHRIPAREQRHIPATGDEPFGDVASHRFPAPYCRGGVRQAIGDRTATLLSGFLILFDDIS
jgi:hypothetical protein